MDIGIVSFLNVSCVGGLYYLLSNLHKETKSLEGFKRAKVYSPNRLLTYFQRDDFKKTSRRSEDNPDEYQIKGFVEGYVDAKSPITSIIDGKTKLVYSLYYRDEIYSNDNYTQTRGFLEPDKKEVKVNAPLYFALRDPHSKSACLVHRSFQVDATQALEKVAETREFKPLNVFEKILLYVGVLIEFLALTTRNTFSFRGIKIGWKENEYGIMVNTALTAYGDIIYNLKEKTLRMDAPQYFLHEKSNIIKKLERMILQTKTKMFLLSIPFILSSIFLLKKVVAFLKEMQRRKREEQLDKLRNVKFLQLQDDYKCIICVDRPRNIILKPCLHFSMCSNCFGSLRRKVCPVCKKNINDAIEVFFT